MQESIKRGFELNEVETKMNGVCLHQDAGCQTELYNIVNFYRLSH
jgi:hypothetical protein